MVSLEKDKSTYWTSLKVGDLVQLKDEQTISDLMERGIEHITHGADFSIVRDRRIVSSDKKIKWLIFEITISDVYLYLVVKINLGSVDVKVCYIPDGFEDGNREDVMEHSDWLFDVPEDENVLLKDYNFVDNVIEDEGGGDEVVFDANPPVYGVCVEKGEEGSSKDFSTVIEYHSSNEDVDNPELFLLELNNITGSSEEDEFEDEDGDTIVNITETVDVNEDDSYIIFIQGCSIPLSQIEILR